MDDPSAGGIAKHGRFEWPIIKGQKKDKDSVPHNSAPLYNVCITGDPLAVLPSMILSPVSPV
jgi:hypothetical protein